MIWNMSQTQSHVSHLTNSQTWCLSLLGVMNLPGPLCLHFHSFISNPIPTSGAWSSSDLIQECACDSCYCLMGGSYWQTMLCAHLQTVRKKIKTVTSDTRRVQEWKKNPQFSTHMPHSKNSVLTKECNIRVKVKCPLK